jgi:DNA repair photolyase
VIIKGRGALSNPAGRFARRDVAPDAEFLEFLALEGELETSPETEVRIDTARSIIARNRSPDIPFTQSINPYRGCEHGCIYCYARQTHAYLDLSPGRDFETKLFYKPQALELLRAELAAPRYEVSPIALGTNTDPYQPIERKLRVTRGILELMLELEHPVTIVTKGGLILRDLDLLAALAERRLAAVMVSLTTLDDDLKRRMEPRTAGPKQRLRIVQALAAARVPTGVMTAPIIPFVNDHELETMLDAAADAGASSAGYVLLRLPHEVRPLFVEWLNEHFPERAKRVLGALAEMHGGELYDSTFGARQRGRGPYAALLAARFERARRALGLNGDTELDTTAFRKPPPPGGQLALWA